MPETKYILIVDDDAAVLSVLRNSLKKFGREYQILTATDGFAALEILQQKPIDIVVTDYQMAGMNGLELLEAIRAIQPETRVIMITAYGTDEIEAQARRLKAYQYLTKPLEVDSFRQLIREALADVAISRPGILILSEKRYQTVTDMLEQLQADVGAQCIMLSDAAGHILARTGDTERLRLSEIVPLLSGVVSSLLEVGRSLADNSQEAINLVYREGAHENLFVVNVGQDILLVVAIERGQYNSRLGSVWYYARQSALSLRKIVGDADAATVPQVLLGEDVADSFDDALEDLFAGGAKVNTPLL